MPATVAVEVASVRAVSTKGAKAGGSDESRAGVPLTNLDQSLFDGAGATKRDLVEYLDGVRERIIPALEHRPLSVIRVHRGQEAFMQKNVPKYTPDWIETVPFWAESSKREVNYAVVQRPPHAAVVRQSTRGGVPPDPGHGRTPRPCDASRPRPRSARGRRLRSGRAGRAPRSSGADRCRSRRCGQDQRRQGRARVRADRRRGVRSRTRPAATRAIAARAEQLDPDIATTAFIKEDRHGKVFVDSTRAGGATVVAAYSPRVRPGVPVSFPLSLGRARRHRTRRLHRPHRARAAR